MCIFWDYAIPTENLEIFKTWQFRQSRIFRNPPRFRDISLKMEILKNGNFGSKLEWSPKVETLVNKLDQRNLDQPLEFLVEN